MSAERSAFTVRRVYDSPGPADGTRVLVDRLWPRGVSKERAALDEWLKTVAPTNELRRWYHADRSRYAEFAERYTAELAGPEQGAALARLAELAGQGPVTLVTAVTDVPTSHVPTLLAALASGS
ncbi:DUF488 domain-containing protein [Streptomyces beijiangensis]|uniref:DUF488 family protein n=1 Tax=Streptomyces beijiangensis TaxID=163361 RepID=A0A939FG84_9ACTN|nr:DUF488 family protein [Streptomyces beijiangensis]MBO0518128.1 DUF488 family protein [Streptomyces beijiangensis]